MIELTEQRIRDAIGRLGGDVGPPIRCVAETGSTNDDARADAALGPGAIFVADAQTRGRGRGGNAWHSPPRDNVYLSLLARKDLPAAGMARASLVVGVAVARAVEAFSLLPARVKWPNDVWIDGKKVAGVLVEARLRGAGVEALVVGVGVNVHGRDFPDEIAARTTSLALSSAPEGLDRAEVIARLVVEIRAAVDVFAASGLASFSSELAARDALVGRRLSVGAVSGVAAGLDADGCLLVRDDGGALHAVSSGSVGLA